jgi:DmsE family decaheme c-type cytochrome
VDNGRDIVGGLISFKKGTRTSVAERNQVCLTCHTKGNRVFWEGGAHEAADIACTNCHTVMKDVTAKSQLTRATVMDTCGTCHLRQRAQQMRNSHMPLREGKMTCTSCHDPHGTVTPALLKENSLNETCYTCHAEKRGPFLWEHPPVLESCANCHDPHGSNHEKMLKLAKPRLCQQCHNEQRIHPTTPYGRGTETLTGASPKFVFGRSCMNCHPTVHGSNHPSGAGLIR